MRTRGKVLVAAVVIAAAGAITATVVAADGPGAPAESSSDAAPRTAPTGEPYPGDAAAETALVDQEAARIVAVKTAASAGASSALDTTRPFRAATSGRATLILPARTAPYTLDELARSAPQTVGADGPEGAYVLREHLAVMTGATFQMGPGERLLLAGDGTGFSTIVALGGAIGIEGSATQAASLASWDPGTGTHDEATADGRPYLRVVGGGLRIVDARIEALGFWSGATGGVAFEGQRTPELVPTPATAGADGVPTMQLSEAPAPDTRLVVSGTEVDGNAVGMTISEADAPALTNVSVSGSLSDGVVLDRDVNAATLTRLTASGNARDGIVVGRGSQSVTLNRATVESNGRNGVLLDGRARADGPSADGTTGASTGASVVGGVFRDNARSGIDVVAGSDIRLRNNTVSGGRMGVVLDEGPHDVEIRNSEIADAVQHGISVRDGAENVTIAGNDVERAEVGVYVRNAEAIVRDNTVAEASIHGITLTGRLTGTHATGNELTGTGPTAIDSDRAIGARVEGNFVDGWAASRSLAQIVATVMQPLTIVWLLVSLLIVVALLSRLGAGRKRNDPLRDPRSLQSMSRGIVRRADAARNAK
jgi:hypothetical protein